MVQLLVEQQQPHILPVTIMNYALGLRKVKCEPAAAAAAAAALWLEG
jgi:hypothetical protein